MTLPQTYFATLVLMILGMICWGSWANTFKMSGRWRFELYYFDFCLGVLLAGGVIAFTFGTMGSDGFQFLDDLLQTGRRNIFYGFLGGVVFNLGNMFLLGAISIAGMAVAYPVSLGVALAASAVWSYIVRPQGSLVLLLGGAVIALAAAAAASFAYKSHEAVKLEMKAKAGMLKTSAPRVSPKVVFLSIGGGLFLGSYYWLLDLTRSYGAGLGPYATAGVFAAGVFLSNFVYSLFFMNLPVEGEPVEVLDYFYKGTWKKHLLGVAGGVIWCSGVALNLVAGAAEGTAKVGGAPAYAISLGAGVLGAAWGLLVWKEFAGADFRVKNLLYLMMVLFLCGVAMVSLGAA